MEVPLNSRPIRSRRSLWRRSKGASVADQPAFQVSLALPRPHGHPHPHPHPRLVFHSRRHFPQLHHHSSQQTLREFTPGPCILVIIFVFHLYGNILRPHHTLRHLLRFRFRLRGSRIFADALSARCDVDFLSANTHSVRFDRTTTDLDPFSSLARYPFRRRLHL